MVADVGKPTTLVAAKAYSSDPLQISYDNGIVWGRRCPNHSRTPRATKSLPRFRVAVRRRSRRPHCPLFGNSLPNSDSILLDVVPAPSLAGQVGSHQGTVVSHVIACSSKLRDAGRRYHLTSGRPSHGSPTNPSEEEGALALVTISWLRNTGTALNDGGTGERLPPNAHSVDEYTRRCAKHRPYWRWMNLKMCPWRRSGGSRYEKWGAIPLGEWIEGQREQRVQRTASNYFKRPYDSGRDRKAFAGVLAAITQGTGSYSRAIAHLFAGWLDAGFALFPRCVVIRVLSR